MLLKQFGGSYTFGNLDDELFINIQYMHICMDAEGERQKLDDIVQGGYQKIFTSGK